MADDYDLMVIGAGIAGLTLARECSRAGMRVGVLEGQPRIGGCLHSARFSIDGREFWVELGAHTLFNSYRQVLTQLAALGLDEALLDRRRLPYRLWQEGKLQSIPAALHWGELLRAIPRAVTQRRSGRRVADYFAAVAGPRNYTEVVEPALNALLCQPAGDFPADLLFKRRERDTTYPGSFSLWGGLSTLTERLAAGLDLQTGAPVERIAREEGAFISATATRRFRSRRLALAVPVADAARLLRPVLPEIAERLSVIIPATIESTVLVVRESPLQPVAGLVGQGAPFYSMVSRDVVPDSGLRGFAFHFRPGLSEEERLAVACRVLRVEPAAVLATAQARHTLPGLRLGHEARMAAIDELLRREPLALAGNYFAGVSIEDCAVRAGREAARLAEQHTGA